jgi:membrane-associated PAP2 superfamily phosphatase
MMEHDTRWSWSGSVGIFMALSAVVAALHLTDADPAIARQFFFDEARGGWLGRHEWWANELLHTGGRNFMRLFGILAVAAWIATFRSSRLAPHRRGLGYFAVCMVVVPLTVGVLKHLTRIDCPWDLEGFGGHRPVLGWLAARSAGLPDAACFPGAHSSSAFALFSLYFVWRPTRPRWAQWALWATILLGALFSVAQQSRGAHFLSHDIASALIAWSICFALTRPASTSPHPTR